MSGGGSARGGGGGPVRVAIPENARKVINNIREITGKQHSDEEIYAVLKDCAMDPNETAQKLLYLDTFHEVKRKRERKKESSNVQGRGGRGGRGNYSDASGGRNAASRKENGASHLRERVPSTGMTGTQRPNVNHSLAPPKVAVVNTNGPSNLDSENPSLGYGSKVAADDAEKSPNTGLVAAKKLGVTSETANLLPISVPDLTADSMTQKEQGKSVSVTKNVPKSNAPGSYSYADASRKGRSQLIAAEPNHGQGNRHVSEAAMSEIPKNEKADPLSLNSEKVSGTPKEADKSQLSELLQPLTLSTEDTSLVIAPSSEYDRQLSQVSITPSKGSSLADGRANVGSQLHPESKPEPTVPNGHVTFPNHFKVPQAVKSGLTFGSFESSSNTGINSSNGHTRGIKSANAIESSHGTADSAKEPSSGQNSSTAVPIDLPDQSESESHQNVLKEVPPSQDNALAEADPKAPQPKQERMQTPDRHQSPTVQLTPNYGLGVLPPIQGVHNVQLDGHEPQARDPSRISPFAGENLAVSSSPSPSPQGQNSTAAAASPQPILLRPPYQLGYLPYSPYFSPYMLHPMHPFLSHNGMPRQQPSAGNPYLTTAAAATAPGVKFPPHPQFKPGTAAANSTPITLPPLYSSYGSSPIGFNPGLAVTSGTSASNEDLSATQLKENRILSTGAPSDVSAWIAQGQDLSSLQLNSLYHLSPQGQHHLTFTPTPQAAATHGPFPGIYPPLQTIPAPSTVSPLLQQQSQAISAAAESVGPPPTAAYQQQPQLTQMNWSSY